MALSKFKSVWLVTLVCLLAALLCTNQQSYFTDGEIIFSYADGHYIFQVGNNILNGEGYSYWNGYQYLFWDYEISTGPTLIYPQVVAQYLGLSKYAAFHYLPLALNLTVLLLLLLLWAKALPRFEFIAVSLLLVLYFASFHQWLWYLPLGEVQSLLWLVMGLSLLFIGDSKLGVVGAGCCFALAMLSKIMVVLILPAIAIYMLLPQQRQTFYYFSVGFLLPLLLFVSSLIALAPEHIDNAFFVQRIKDFLYFSASWALPELSIQEKVHEIGWLNKFVFPFQQLNQPFTNAAGYVFFAVLSVQCAVAVCTLVRKTCDRRWLACYILTAAILLILFAWVFVIGMKVFRYALIFFPLLLLFSLASCRAVSLTFFKINVALLLLLFVTIIAWRGLIYPERPYDQLAETLAAGEGLNAFVEKNAIEQVLFTDALYTPYLNLSIAIKRADLLLSLNAFIDAQTPLTGLDECMASKGNIMLDAMFYIGSPTSPSSICRKKNIALTYRWDEKINSVWLLDQARLPNNMCGQPQWMAGRYHLYHCDSEQLRTFVERSSAGMLRLLSAAD